MKSHHNSTHEQGELLQWMEVHAIGQEALVLAAFRRGAASPSEIHARAFSDQVPLTSVRRAITNLTQRGLLERTAIKVRGPFGRPEYVWRRAACRPE